MSQRIRIFSTRTLLWKLALMGALVSCSSVHIADSSGVERNVAADEPKNAADIRDRKLLALLPVMRQALVEPGAIGDSVRDALNQKEQVLLNQETTVPESVEKSRVVVASLFKNETTRGLLTEMAVGELNRLSASVKGAVFAAQGPVVVDQIVVGMGPHGAAYAQEITNKDPRATVLLVEATNQPGGTFARVGSAFALNSTNRKDTGERAQPGSGDLNKVHDIVGLPDYKGRRWAEAGSVGEVTTIGSYLSSALPLMETRVEKVEKVSEADPLFERTKAENTPRYKVTLSSGGTRKAVYTNFVVFSTGIGTPKAFGEVGTDTIIAQEKESAQAARLPAPRIEAFTDFVNRVGNPENKTPIRDLVGKEVAIIGGGDSGRVLVELLTGLGPESGYKADVAQVGQVKKIYWFVGYDGFETCKDYIAETRARYSQIAQALNSGLVVPVVGRVGKIARAGAASQGLFTLDTSYRNRAGNIVNLQGEVRYIQPGDERTGAEAEKVQKSVNVSKVIIASGFDNALPKIVDSLSTRKFEDAWKLKEYSAEGFDKNTRIAREHREAPGVFLAGPANESLGGLPAATELAGVNANTVSLFANVERTKGLAQAIAQSDAPTTSARADRSGLKEVRSQYYQSLVQQVVPVGTNGNGRGEFSVSVAPSILLRPLPNFPSTEFALRVALDRSMRPYAPETRNGEAVLTLKAKPGGYDVSVSGVVGADAESIRKSFESNELLNRLLFKKYFREGPARVSEVEVALPIRQGRFSYINMNVRTIRGR
jgi:hypothetical protein